MPDTPFNENLAASSQPTRARNSMLLTTGDLTISARASVRGYPRSLHSQRLKGRHCPCQAFMSDLDSAPKEGESC